MAIIRSHLLIITLNINESKSPINVHRKAKFFFRFDTKSNQWKTKVGQHQTKKHLPSKGNHPQNQKATYAVGENIYKSYIW